MMRRQIIATEYGFKDEFEDMYNLSGIKINRMNSPFYDGIKWAVRKLSYCLNKSREWEFEPMPSSRDNEFYKRCRFDTFKEAYEECLKIKEVEDE